MNKKITSSSYSFEISENSCSKQLFVCLHKSPSAKSLHFLRTFARNYRASTLLPETLPGLMLG